MSDLPMVYPYADVSGDPADTRIAIRASAFGKPLCQLVAAACGHDPVPPPEFLLKAFGEGHTLEPVIMERLGRMGWELDELDDEQETVELPGPGFVIRGHIDGKGQRNSDGEQRIIEAKALGPDLFAEARAWGPQELLGGEYANQLAIYMHATKMPATWAILAKERGDDGTVDIDRHYDTEMLTVHVDEPPVDLPTILRRGREIVKAIKAAGGLGSLALPEGPSACPISDTGKYPFPCPFHYLHDEDGDVDGWGNTSDDDATDEAIEAFGGDRVRQVQWAEAAAKYAKARDEEAAAKKAREKARDLLVAMHEDAGGRTRLRGLGFTVRVKTTERKGSVDYRAMTRDGIDVEKYRKPGSSSRSVEVEQAAGAGGKS